MRHWKVIQLEEDLKAESWFDGISAFYMNRHQRACSFSQKLAAYGNKRALPELNTVGTLTSDSKPLKLRT